MDKRLPKLSDMQRAREQREAMQHAQDALLALVKRAKRLVVPLAALQDLKAGDNLAIEVVPGEGLVLTYVPPGGTLEPAVKSEPDTG